MPIWYLGASPAEDTSAATIDYVNSLALQNLSDSEVKQKIKDYFANTAYASQTWGNSVINSATTGQAFARQTDLDAGIANKIPVLGNDDKGNAIIARANGPVALTSYGKIDPALISKASQQTLPVLNWSPSSYTVVSNISAETNICSLVVNPSLSSYRVFVSGTVNARIGADGQYPIVQVRAVPTGTGTATSGTIVATGYGVAENYPGGTVSQFTVPGAYVYQIPTWANKIDVVVLGAGGGGFSNGGGGGGAGKWASRTFVRGTELPNNVTALTGTVGEGAASKNTALPFTYGGPTVCDVPALGTLTGEGGQTGENNLSALLQTGSGPGDYTPPSNSRITYKGGANQTVQGAAGNSPGGGGAGGGLGLGGKGGNGAAFFYAYINDDNNYGQIGVVPAPMSGQAALSGSTTLYVNVLRGSFSGSGSSTVSTSSFNPQISVMVVPA